MNGYGTSEPDWRVQARAIMALQDEAYSGPTGTWAQRWLPRVCKHLRVRCTHGDEIIARRWRRRVCMVCGRSLQGPLPRVCFFSPSGATHPSHVGGASDVDHS